MFLSNNASVNLSYKFFNIRKPLELVIFDKLFKKFVLNPNNKDELINEFHKDGYVKLNLDIKEEINNIKKNLKLKGTEDNPPFYFDITDEIKDEVSKILNLKLKDTLSSLELYFNSKILPAMVNIRRNTHYQKENFSTEFYSDNYHNDAYALTHFKIFINLMDINEENGPMFIVSKKHAEEFTRNIKYKNRGDYKQHFELNDMLYKNVGKQSDALLFDPTQCFHRATIPKEGYHRDYIIFTFICLPKKLDLKENSLDNVDIYKYKNNPLIKFAKPHTLLSTLKTFSKYLK